MKRLHLLLTLCLLALAHADETAPSPCGKSFTVSGSITHFKTPANVSIDGDDNLGTFGEEVYGPSFTAKVEGLPEGDYKIEIDLAEVYSNAPDQRVIHIASGETILADHLDLIATAGFAKAYKIQGTVHHLDDAVGGPLTLTFTGIKGNAKFNAIHIYDSQGGGVACVKAIDLVDTADAAASKIPQVSGPILYTDPDRPMNARIDDLIRRMSLSEKAGQLVNAAPAIPRLNLPAYNYWSECLHGVARNGHATVFPQAIGMAATWDDGLVYRIGQVIADEGRAKYYQAIRDGEGGKDNRGLNFWAPNINIFRDPRWGRGQETYGEDPFLTSRIAVGFITGIQQMKNGYLEAMACAKHFAVHSGPEAGRRGFNVDPDTRDLYETYLPQFEAAVEEAKVGAVMAAYNAIYGVPSAANRWLLTDLLRGTWGFQGHVVSDCGAVGNISGEQHYAQGNEAAAAAALNAGLDLECGGTFRALPKALSEGLVTEKEIDTALHRVLEIRFRLGLFDPPERVPFSNIPMSDVESPAHLELARAAARESIVLLKNDGGVLPLDKSKLKRVAVIGPNASTSLNGNYEGQPTHSITILEGIQKELGAAVPVDYAQGAPLTYKTNQTPNSEMFHKAVAMAKADDLIIYVGGLDTQLEGEESSYESPGFSHGDRTRIELPEAQEKLLRALRATGKSIVFINCSGSAIAMPWEAQNIPAILQAWYPGGEAGTAVADVLFGKYNPAGRLPVTFYAKTEDLPAFTDYRMANRTYRYFQGKPLFPFGHGLSYTTFQYLPPTPATASINSDETLHIEIPIKNAGQRAGDEVVQVYLRHKDSPVPQPIHSLIAFRRVSISAGATTSVAFEIPVERFHYWNIKKDAYVIDPGAYDVEIGASSSDIRQVCRITVNGD